MYRNRLDDLALEAALDLAASSPRADYTAGQLPSLPLPVQATDIIVIYRGSSQRTYGVPSGALAGLVNGSTAPQEKPAGRLTLTSGQPVMTADVNSTAIVYYTPYVGNLVPIYNGTTWVMMPFVETALTLTAGNNIVGNVYDVFGYINSAGVFALACGPAWTAPASSRGSGAGTTQIQQVSGLWVNSVSMTATNGATTVTINAQNGTYLGTFYCNANAAVTMNFKPAPVVGGSNNILGLYNAYNRVNTKSIERDSQVAIPYAVNTWRALTNSVANRVTFIDGLQQNYLEFDATLLVGLTTANSTPTFGVNLDSTVATPLRQGFASVPSVASSGEIDMMIEVSDSFLPVLGLHFFQAMQFAGGAVSSNFQTSGAGGQNYYGLRVILEM